MITLAFIIVFGLLGFFFGKFIRKFSVYIYLAILLLAITAFILRNVPIFKFINQGFFGLALFYVVMITGAFPNKSKLRTRLMGVRKEYSILGFIAILPHALIKLLSAFNGQIAYAWFGIAVIVLMTPLFITSFMFIRKKMSFKAWKILQSFAYLIYLLLLVHLILDYTLLINLIAYIVIFGVYIILKVIFEIKKYITKKQKAKQN
jgi:DMSO/TMAO reductase YedYZ heme-binding membrane subunit